MKHVLMVWELGAGLGHIARLHLMAKALTAKGVRVTFIIRRHREVNPWLAQRGWANFPAPKIALNRRQQLTPICHADWYLYDGFEQLSAVGDWIRKWRQLIDVLRPDSAILDFAPLAAYALHLMGIPYMVSSIGFCAPPYADRAVCFRPWEPDAQKRADQSNARLRQIFLQYRKWLGPLAAKGFEDLFDPSLLRLCTFEEFDHFPERQKPTKYHGVLWGDVSKELISWRSDDARKKIFCYLNGYADHLSGIIQVLKNISHEIIAVMPQLTAQQNDGLESSYHRFIVRSLDVTGILNDCDLVICHGGIGLAARSLCLGVPVMSLPSHAEQAIFTRRLTEARLGVATFQAQSTNVLNQKIVAALNDDHIKESVKKFQKKYESHSPQRAATASLVPVI